MYSSYFFSEDVDYDQWVDENGHQLIVDVPGVKKEDLDVFVEGNHLDISWKRENSWKRESESNLQHKGRRYGKKRLSFKLPESIDRKKISSNLENGVLNISIPKKVRDGPKKIPILIK